METMEFVYSKLTGMTVEMKTQEEKDMTMLNGRAMLNETEKRLMFVQNMPRGPRSVEVGRTVHSRIVRRPDGAYTLTFRFRANEKLLKETLLVEVRKVVTIAMEDAKSEERGAKNLEQK